jgi:hypothetical protein
MAREAWLPPNITRRGTTVKKLKLLIELEYDDVSMHGANEDEKDYFFRDVLGADPAEHYAKLTLHSNFLGETIGSVKVLSIVQDSDILSEDDMKLEEYKAKLSAIEIDAKLAKRAAAREYALANNTVRIGDTVTDHIGAIRVDEIKIYYFGTPQCVYVGVELRKDGTPTNQGKTRSVFQSNVIAVGHASSCREDGRCQYAIDSGAEGMARCQPGKCVMQSDRV